MKKVLVITERGRIVGTQVVSDPPAGQRPASAGLRAGPGQKLHHLEVEAPTVFASAKEMQAFHDSLARRLKPKKQARKKRR